MALPSRFRLRGRRCFDHLYRAARVLRGHAMVLRVATARPGALRPQLRREPASPWRCAVVISGKACRQAVDRNRLRRVLHEFLRHRLAEAAAAAEAPATQRWLLISLRPGCLAAGEASLLKECGDLLDDAGVRP
jgi:ribonuclease P protein component